MRGPSKTKNNFFFIEAAHGTLCGWDVAVDLSLVRHAGVIKVKRIAFDPALHFAVSSPHSRCLVRACMGPWIPPPCLWTSPFHKVQSSPVFRRRNSTSMSNRRDAEASLRASTDPNGPERSDRDVADPRHVVRAPRDVFRRGGPKVEQMGSRTTDPVHGDADASRVALKEMYALWRAPHAASRKHLMVLAWIPTLGLAKMQAQRGKLWRSMGFTHGKEHYFYVEEAVYLMQRASASIVDDETGEELSVQEAMMIMREMGVSMDRYMAYVHLRRGGYVVTRHPAQWTLDRSMPIQTYAKRLGSAWQDPCWMPGGRTERETIVQRQAVETDAGGSRHRKPRGTDRKRKRGKESTRPTQQKLSAPSNGNKHEAWWPKADGNHPWLCLQRVELPPPILAQVRVNDFGHTLDNLKPYAPYQNNDHEPGNGMVMFDVYHPNNQFSRKDCGPPSFRLCIAEGRVPEHNRIRKAVAMSDVDVKLAVVDSGAVLYFTLKETVLPCL